MSPDAPRLPGLALALAVLVPFAVQGQAPSFERFQKAAVGVRVVKPEPLSPETGSGFIVSVDEGIVVILTARHLFYGENSRESFRKDVKVTFRPDSLNEYPAEWRIDYPSFDVAVLGVRADKLPQSLFNQLKEMPALPVHPHSTSALTVGADVFVFSGNSQAWQVPKVTISDTWDNDRQDRFRFTGIGVRSGFSGSPLSDAGGALVGIHLGAIENDETYGHAQEITSLIPVLAHDGIHLNKLNITAVEGALNISTSIKGPSREQEIGPPARLPGSQDAGSGALATRPVIVEAGGFSFSLVSCKRSGDGLFCDLQITNRRADRRFVINADYGGDRSRIIDQSGREFLAGEVHIGANSFGGHADTRLITGVPVASSIAFFRTPEDLSAIRLLELHCYAEGVMEANGYFNAQFRNVSVTSEK